MHKGIFGLCTCALVKPFGHFLVGLVFDFWRDVCGNNGDRAKADLAQAQEEIRRLREIVASYAGQ